MTPTIAILAGGQSRRMGTDKSFVQLGDKPLIAHVVERVSALALATIVIANDQDPYRFLDLPIFSDLVPGKGSLGGLYTALYHSATTHTLCVACDMPCLNPALLRYLIEQSQDYDAVIPRLDSQPQPLHALYHKTCLPLIAQQVANDQLRVREFFPLINARYVDEDELRAVDPRLASFINVNTPEALAALQNSDDPCA